HLRGSPRCDSGPHVRGRARARPRGHSLRLAGFFVPERYRPRPNRLRRTDDLPRRAHECSANQGSQDHRAAHRTGRDSEGVVMDMIDAVASMVFTVIAAVALKHGWERLFPSDESAADLGYIPDSEAPPWGWPVTIMLGVA